MRVDGHRPRFDIVWRVARRRLTGQLQTTEVNALNPVVQMEAAEQVVEMRAVKRPAQPGPPLRPEMAPRLRT